MAANPFVDGHGAAVKEVFVLAIDLFIVPVGMVGFHELDHPEACEGAILRSKPGEVASIKEVIEAGNDRKKAHGRARRKRPAKPPARAPKISVSRAARRPPPTNSR